VPRAVGQQLEDIQDPILQGEVAAEAESIDEVEEIQEVDHAAEKGEETVEQE
jgi:hypothetical protein